MISFVDDLYLEISTWETFPDRFVIGHRWWKSVVTGSRQDECRNLSRESRQLRFLLI